MKTKAKVGKSSDSKGDDGWFSSTLVILFVVWVSTACWAIIPNVGIVQGIVSWTLTLVSRSLSVVEELGIPSGPPIEVLKVLWPIGLAMLVQSCKFLYGALTNALYWVDVLVVRWWSLDRKAQVYLSAISSVVQTCSGLTLEASMNGSVISPQEDDRIGLIPTPFNTPGGLFFLIKHYGETFLVTADHVIPKADADGFVTVTLVSVHATRVLRLKSFFRRTAQAFDLAVLEIPPRERDILGMRAFKLESLRKVTTVAVKTNAETSVGLAKQGTTPFLINHFCSTRPGFSGAPIVTGANTVVGVHCGHMKGEYNYGYSFTFLIKLLNTRLKVASLESADETVNDLDMAYSASIMEEKANRNVLRFVSEHYDEDGGLYEYYIDTENNKLIGYSHADDSYRQWASEVDDWYDLGEGAVGGPKKLETAAEKKPETAPTDFSERVGPTQPSVHTHTQELELATRLQGTILQGLKSEMTSLKELLKEQSTRGLPATPAPNAAPLKSIGPLPGPGTGLSKAAKRRAKKLLNKSSKDTTATPSKPVMVERGMQVEQAASPVKVVPLVVQVPKSLVSTKDSGSLSA
jgi:hypothetical protein